MPGFDGTGPAGQGPLTGRGMGYCVMPLGENTNNPYFMPYVNMGRPAGYANYNPYLPARRLPVRLGMGRGRGRRGMGRR